MHDLVLDVFYPAAGVFASDGTFPDKAHAPALVLVVLYDLFVTLPVALEFIAPELLVGRGKAEITTVAVCVPEAAVYEDYGVVAGED